MSTDPKMSLKIVTSGEGRVGKTSLISRYVHDRFKKRYKMTIGCEFFSKLTNVNGTNYMLVLWDFGGQRRFRSLLENYITGSKGAIFMFDLTRIETLETVEEWIKILRKIKDLPILLVGTKADLVMAIEKSSEAYIDHVIKQYGFIDFVKTSAKMNVNVDHAFELLVKKIIEKHENELPK